MGIRLKLTDVRLSYPNLFTPRKYDENEPNAKEKFDATFLMEKGGQQHQLVLKAILAACKEKWEEKGEQMFKLLMAQDRQICIHDGDMRDADGYSGNMFVHAVGSIRPGVRDVDNTPIKSETVGRPYAGCYVNAVVEVYAQVHQKGGKRVNCSLVGVQFLRDGPAFAGAVALKEDEFDNLADHGQNESADIGQMDEETRRLLGM